MQLSRCIENRSTADLRTLSSQVATVSAPRGTRTPSLRFRRPPLYPIELWAQKRDRHLARSSLSLAGGTAILESGPRESNPHGTAWEAVALPHRPGPRKRGGPTAAGTCPDASIHLQSEQRDSNPRKTAWKAAALTTRPCSRCTHIQEPPVGIEPHLRSTSPEHRHDASSGLRRSARERAEEGRPVRILPPAFPAERLSGADEGNRTPSLSLTKGVLRPWKLRRRTTARRGSYGAAGHWLPQQSTSPESRRSVRTILRPPHLQVQFQCTRVDAIRARPFTVRRPKVAPVRLDAAGMGGTRRRVQETPEMRTGCV